MTLTKKVMLTLLFWILLYQSALALQIASPKEGEIFFAGSDVTLVIKPDSGEEWEYVIYGMSTLSYNPLLKEYRTTLRIPANLVGYEKLSVIGLDKSGKETELIRNILVKLPPNVVLKSIMVFDQDYMLLYKLPAGSKPEDMQRIETEQLSVSGMYSDGVKRKLTSSTSGTTYTTNNEKIVTVDSDGKVTAQSIGTAKITVKNGKYSAQVDIVVKPYRQPQK